MSDSGKSVRWWKSNVTGAVFSDAKVVYLSDWHESTWTEVANAAGDPLPQQDATQATEQDKDLVALADHGPAAVPDIPIGISYQGIDYVCFPKSTPAAGADEWPPGKTNVTLRATPISGNATPLEKIRQWHTWLMADCHYDAATSRGMILDEIRNWNFEATPAAGAEEPNDNPPSALFPDGVPELTDEEKAAIDDSLDMTDTIGTEEQGIRHALRTALKYMRESKANAAEVARLIAELNSTKADLAAAVAEIAKLNEDEWQNRN